ncbi:MAG: cytochrome c [Bacteroidia bacterium]|nr:cytochrome c [Bacteroidia bacterium]
MSRSFKFISLTAFLVIVYYFSIVANGMINPPISIFADSNAGVAFCGTVDMSPANDPANDHPGRALFRTSCTACHKMQGKLVGPPLMGVVEKYKGQKEWLHSWIKNSRKMIEEGDPQAVALFKEYNELSMQTFTNLSDEDISGIISYMEAYTREAKEMGY